MSQAKVDKYKEAKKKPEKADEKRKDTKAICAEVWHCIVAAALIGMAGFSIYNIYESKTAEARK